MNNSRSIKYMRWQRISGKYQMSWKDIRRFTHLYPTHNTAYLKRNRRVWVWAWWRKKTMEIVEMVIKHICWTHAPGTPSRFYTIKSKKSINDAWFWIKKRGWRRRSDVCIMHPYDNIANLTHLDKYRKKLP